MLHSNTPAGDLAMVNNFQLAVTQGPIPHIPNVSIEAIRNFYSGMYEQGLPMLDHINTLIIRRPLRVYSLTNIDYMTTIHDTLA